MFNTSKIFIKKFNITFAEDLKFEDIKQINFLDQELKAYGYIKEKKNKNKKDKKNEEEDKKEEEKEENNEDKNEIKNDDEENNNNDDNDEDNIDLGQQLDYEKEMIENMKELNIDKEEDEKGTITKR